MISWVEEYIKIMSDKGFFKWAMWVIIQLLKVEVAVNSDCSNKHSWKIHRKYYNWSGRPVQKIDFTNINMEESMPQYIPRLVKG